MFFLPSLSLSHSLSPASPFFGPPSSVVHELKIFLVAGLDVNRQSKPGKRDIVIIVRYQPSSRIPLPPLLMPPDFLSLSLSLSSLCSALFPPTWCASLSRTKIAAALFRLLARPFSVSPCTRSCTPRLRSCSSILLRAALFDSFNDDLSMDDTMNILSCVYASLAEGLSGKWTERIELRSDFLLSYSRRVSMFTKEFRVQICKFEEMI